MKSPIIKSLAIAMTITALLVAISVQAVPQTEKSLYERLGGVYAIAAVINHFSDAIVQNPMVGKNSKNPALRKWHTNNLDRLPGLKFMRTLWVCEVTGGPFKFSPTKPGKTPLGLEEAHRDLNISPAEFDISNHALLFVDRRHSTVLQSGTFLENAFASFGGRVIGAGGSCMYGSKVISRSLPPLS